MKAEVELRCRVVKATIARRIARWQQLPVPPETNFLDSIPTQDHRRLLDGGSVPPGFAERLAERLNAAAMRMKNGSPRDPRKDYERLIIELRELNNLAEQTDNRR